MLTALLVGLMATTFVMPTIIALCGAVYGFGYQRYVMMALGIMVAIGLHAGIWAYSSMTYPDWWDSWVPLMGLVQVVYVVANGFGIFYSVLLSTKVDKDRANDLPFGDNLHPFRRNAS